VEKAAKAKGREGERAGSILEANTIGEALKTWSHDYPMTSHRPLLQKRRVEKTRDIKNNR
jgi:hypothetical protein